LIWDEVGESEEDRDKVLYQLDQECLDVYKRKVDQATNSRDLLIQALDDSKIELARLLSALGEKAIARTVSEYILCLEISLMSTFSKSDPKAKA
jgi:protein regulator of cytokinesis 1